MDAPRHITNVHGQMKADLYVAANFSHYVGQGSKEEEEEEEDIDRIQGPESIENNMACILI